jgi:phosphatidylserine/phosphatidylglycerophosphate/cardiolipin synthase-like enzyme
MQSSNSFAKACSDLIGQVATNSTLANAIVIALATEQLTPTSGPMAMSKVLKGAAGKHYLSEFLKAWKMNAPHLGAKDVGSMVGSSLNSYRIAHDRAHDIDIVWTGPEVSGSEVRRTEAVVREIIAGADRDLLIVGYWLVTGTSQIKELINQLIDKARDGVRVRFVFDPGVKPHGKDNFTALEEQWPSDLVGAPREVYTWSEHMTMAENKAGKAYARKLHAKVIVGDRWDTLVTSANLTNEVRRENLEMGLRAQGVKAGEVVRHFDLLIEEGVLVLRS